MKILSLDISMTHTGVIIYETFNDKIIFQQEMKFGSKDIEQHKDFTLEIWDLINKWNVDIVLFEDNSMSRERAFGSPTLQRAFVKSSIGSLKAIVAIYNLIEFGDRLYIRDNLDLVGYTNSSISTFAREGLKHAQKPAKKNGGLSLEQWILEKEYLGIKETKKINRASTIYKKAVSKKYYEEQIGTRLDNDNITDAYCLVRKYMWEKNNES